MKLLIKPLPKKMLAHLRRGREIELSETERNICSTDDFKDTLPRLCRRGYIDIKIVTVDDQEILSVYITRAGIEFLDKYKDVEKKQRSRFNFF